MRALITIFSAVFIVACDAPPKSLNEQWRDDLAAHGAVGRAGSFHLSGNEIVSSRSPATVVEAPFSGSVRVQATVAEGSGYLHCVDDVEVSAGRVEGVAIFEVRTSATSAPEVRFNAASEAPARAVNLVIDDAAGCVLATDDGEFIEVTGGSSVTTSGQVDPLSLVIRRGVDFHADEVAVAGDGSGSATVAGEEILGVNAVFAVDADVQVAGTDVDGAGRISQAFTAAGPAFDASLELASPEATVDDGSDIDARVIAGSLREIEVMFRENGFDADAVVSSYRVDLDGAVVEQSEQAAVRIAASAPQGTVGQLVDSIGEAGIAAPVMALAVAVALPFAILIDIVDQALSVQPDPLPAIVGAGSIGKASVVVDGAQLDVGDHEIVLIVGGNFDEVRLTVHAHVVAPE